MVLCRVRIRRGVGTDVDGVHAFDSSGRNACTPSLEHPNDCVSILFEVNRARTDRYISGFGLGGDPVGRRGRHGRRARVRQRAAPNACKTSQEHPKDGVSILLEARRKKTDLDMRFCVGY